MRAEVLELGSEAREAAAEGLLLSPAYRRWSGVAEVLVRPLAKLMEDGGTGLSIEGPASNHDVVADRLESFARPCLLASHWLQAKPVQVENGVDRGCVAEWFRRGLVIGTDPEHPEYWGPAANCHQNIVEMGALVLALEIARPWLWNPLSHAERARILRWFASARGTALHRNNHMFFGVLALGFLGKEGAGLKTDRTCIGKWMDTLEGMYLGGGWFIDGMNETVDYYNAYAFHYYGLWWSFLYGQEDRGRTERWQGWTRQFLEDYVHFFAASGEPVPFGRSQTYRFAAIAPVALAELVGVSPLPAGMARRLCTRNLSFFLKHRVHQRQGALNLGWVDEFPEMAEAYSSAGSTYWAGKGLAPLLLGPESAFWNDPERPLPSERGDSVRPIPQAGLVVRSVGGEVELYNAGTAICGGNTYFGAYKWGKLSYRTGVGFEIQSKGGEYPLDAALSARDKNGNVYGRQSTHVLEVDPDHMACLYALGNKSTRFHLQVETRIWWREAWQLQLHRYRAHEDAELILGSYSLGAEHQGKLLVRGGFPEISAYQESHGIWMRALVGFESFAVKRVLPGEHSRTHLLGPASLTLLLQKRVKKQEEGWLAALIWTGDAMQGCLPMKKWCWEISDRGRWQFFGQEQPDEVWEIRDEELPALGDRDKCN
jgi:hypothetical protein